MTQMLLFGWFVRSFCYGECAEIIIILPILLIRWHCPFLR